MARYSWIVYVVSFIIVGIILGFVFAFFIGMFSSMGARVPYLDGYTLQWTHIPNPDPTAFPRAFWGSLPMCLGVGFLLSFVLVSCMALNNEVCSR